MLVAGVIDNQVQHDPDPSLARLMHHRREVTETAQSRVQVVVVGDVVPTVPPRRRVYRVEPDGGDTQPAQVVQPGHQALEVAYPVTVGILEHADVQGVEDTSSVPAGQHCSPPAPKRSCYPVSVAATASSPHHKVR